jgi:hypothetical protein
MQTPQIKFASLAIDVLLAASDAVLDVNAFVLTITNIYTECVSIVM